MARRGGRKSRSRMTRPSAISRISRSLTLRLPRPVVLRPRQLVEDRRHYHPLGPARSPRVFSGHPVKPHVVRPSRGRSVPAKVRFAEPRKTLVCVRRKERREVLFARGRTGKGSGFGRKRRNKQSEITC